MQSCIQTYFSMVATMGLEESLGKNLRAYIQGCNAKFLTNVSYIPHFAFYGGIVKHNYGTRSNRTTVRIPRVRREVAKKSFWFQGPACFNELPFDILCSDSIVAFKHRLKEHLKGLLSLFYFFCYSIF